MWWDVYGVILLLIFLNNRPMSSTPQPEIRQEISSTTEAPDLGYNIHSVNLKHEESFKQSTGPSSEKSLEEEVSDFRLQVTQTVHENHEAFSNILPAVASKRGHRDTTQFNTQAYSKTSDIPNSKGTTDFFSYDDLDTNEERQCPPLEQNHHLTRTIPKTKIVENKGVCLPNNESIVVSSSLAISYIDSFKDSYTLAAFGATWKEANSIFFHDEENDIKWLNVCDQQQHCLPVLPKLPPPPHLPPTTQDSLKGLLIQLVGLAQRYSVALNSLILDQSLSENQFLSEMTQTRRNLVDVVGVLMSSLKECYLQPQVHLIQELAQKTHVEVDGGIADERGFRVLRQCLLGLQYFIDMFPMDQIDK